MSIIHIDSINPNLRNFLFESRKFVLKNGISGYGYSCYTKNLDSSFKYLTMVPNSGTGNFPVDFLEKINENFSQPYILLGSYLEKIPISEYNLLLNEIEKLMETEGYLDIPSEKLDMLFGYYTKRLFSDNTIERMLYLKYYFDENLRNNFMSDFNYRYYRYYNAIENARKERLKTALLVRKFESKFR